MKKMPSIAPLVMQQGSSDAKCAASGLAWQAKLPRASTLVRGFLLVVAMSSPLLASAVDTSKKDGPPANSVEVKRITWTNGEIKNIDAEMGKLTIKHERLVNLHMPAMTMLFKVSKASLCDGLKVGDKIRFAAESVHGSLVITELEKLP